MSMGSQFSKHTLRTRTLVSSAEFMSDFTREGNRPRRWACTPRQLAVARPTLLVLLTAWGAWLAVASVLG